jgi:hypothetical protein
MEEEAYITDERKQKHLLLTQRIPHPPPRRKRLFAGAKSYIPLFISGYLLYYRHQLPSIYVIKCGITSMISLMTAGS